MLLAQHKKDLLIQFELGKELNAINAKVILKIDTGADVKALNRKTFKNIFQQVQLQPSNIILRNFGNIYVRPWG